MPNNLANNVDFGEAGPRFGAAPQSTYDTMRAHAPSYLQNRLARRAIVARIQAGKGTVSDYIQVGLAVPGHILETLVDSAISGATLPGDVVAGKYNPQPVAEGDSPEGNLLVQAQKEAELPGRAMDLAGLASFGSIAVPAEAEAGVALGSGAMKKTGELPMDAASRATRAKEQGFTIDAYHGTRSPKDFEEFSTDGPPVGDESSNITDSGSGADPSAYMGAHFALEPQVASKFAEGKGASWLKSRHVEEGQAGGRVIPVKLRGKFKEFKDDEAVQQYIYQQPSNHYAVEAELDRRTEGDLNQLEALGERYNKDPIFREEINRDAMGSEYDNEDGGVSFAQDLAFNAKSKLKSEGYHGFKHKNIVEGGHAIAVFDPENIRSHAAAFDPAESSSGNILMSGGKKSAAAGAAELAADKPQLGQAAFRFRGKLYTDDFHAGAIDKFLQANGYKKAAEGGLDDAVKDMPDLQDVSDESLGGIGKDGKFVPFTSDEISKTPRSTGGFFANKSKEAGALFLAAGKTKDPFYSVVERAVEASPTKAASGDQWLATLKNTPGVKGEEIDQLGLAEQLKGKAKVSKDEVQQAIQQNKVKLEEHWKTSDASGSSEDVASAREYLNGIGYEGDLEGQSGNEIIQNAMDEGWEPEHLTEDVPDTKFSEYQLPGGENYRELVVTLPKNELPKGYSVHEVAPGYGGRRSYYVKRPDGSTNEAAWSSPEAAIEAELRKGQYRSSHWDEPNVLAHVRMNDRYLENPQTKTHYRVSTPDGDYSHDFKTRAEAQKWRDNAAEEDRLAGDAYKVEEVPVTEGTGGAKTLFLEELQSDWHQAGRKQGYRGIVDTKGWKVERGNDGQDFQVVKDADGQYKGEFRLSGKSDDEVIQYAANGTNDPHAMVPDAPFKKSWPELLLKRMVREAAEKGYDQIAWTNGVTQAERYDLSKHISSIEFDKEPKYATEDPETWTNPPATEKHDVRLRIRDKEGRDVHVQGLGRLGVYTWQEVTDTLGKEIAEKIQKSESKQGKLEGLDLKVGGEGMKGFYDDMLPKIANKAFGKWGGKVKTEKLQEEGGYGTDIVSKLEDHGYDLEDPRHMDDSYDWVRKDLLKKHNGRLPHWITEAELDSLEGGFMDVPESVGRSRVIHVLPITPELRKKALSEGFSLFSSGVPLPDDLTDTGPEAYHRDPVEKGVKLTPVDHVPEFEE